MEYDLIYNSDSKKIQYLSVLYNKLCFDTIYMKSQ